MISACPVMSPAAGEAILCSGIDHDGRGAAGHAESAKAAHVVPTPAQFVVNRVCNSRFDIQFVEARGVRPERTVEVMRLDAWPFEGRVQVRIPVIPEFNDARKACRIVWS
jgi:hypothetical protein